MSSIFKPRKIPRHLIIRDEREFYRKSRFSLGRLLWWIALAGIVTVALIQFNGTYAL